MGESESRPEGAVVCDFSLTLIQLTALVPCSLLLNPHPCTRVGVLLNAVYSFRGWNAHPNRADAPE